MTTLEGFKGLGGYTTTGTLVVIALLTWWKVLPAIIDAIANRQSKIEERMGSLLDDATARFTRQIAEADQRHDECMNGQRKLVERIDEQDAKIAEQSRTIGAQDETIAGLRKQFSQLQASAVRLDGTSVSDIARGVVDSLDRIDAKGSA